MINDQILGYVRSQKGAGVSEDVIRQNLKGAGWLDSDISEAFAALPQALSTAPPVSPAPTPETTSPVLPTGPKGKNFKYIAVVATVVLLALAGGIYGHYSGVFLSMSKLTQEAIGGMREVESASYDNTVSIDFSEATGALGYNPLMMGLSGASKFTFTAKGAYDRSDKENLKNFSEVDVSFGAIDVSVEIRVVGGTLYFKLDEALSAETLTLPFLSGLEREWIAVEYKGDAGALTNPLGSLAGGSAKIQEQLTEEQKKHLFKLFQQARLIKPGKKFSPEEINGAKAYHFAFDLDREGIAAYLSSVKDYINEVGKGDSAMTVFDPTPFSKSLDKLKDFKGELWIGKADRLPRKALASFSFNVGTEEQEALVKVTSVSIFGDWGEPVEVSPPEQSSSFEEFVSRMFGGALAEARDKGKDAAIKANLANMRALGELYWDSHNNSYLGFCASKDAVLIRENIKDNSGSEMVCKDTTVAWASRAKLTTGSFFCVDSTGAAKEVKSPTSGTVCSQ